MKKKLLFIFASALAICQTQAQTKDAWTTSKDGTNKMVTDKAVTRQSFPKEFKLYDLNTQSMRETLFSTKNNLSKNKTIISLPNTEGQIEDFEIHEDSNFEDDLQARFPEIRAYSGKGITDKYATLKLSISPQGIQTMIFRTDKENEFIEPYSQDHTVYAVFKSQREKGKLPWTCGTDDKKMIIDLKSQLANTNRSSTGQLKTMRLAQSCNGEYAAYFGASTAGNATDQGKVLAAFNATLTRCNGVYERDLALHLNLVANTTNIIYYNSETDPYSTTLSQWNTQLQEAINTTLTGVGTTLAANNAAYDIGHMFGGSGGGGNAGCIGCVCVDGVTGGTGSTKGRGITAPSDGIPMGDNFDIDYVVHEIGHQLGGNHTYSNGNEGAGVNMEVGSGVTIMGYAGITSQDVAAHSIDKYHAATIMQIQANLAGKSCPVTTNIATNNATPVVNAGANYLIPISTPFVLTAVGSDANTEDALTYSWEEFDDGATSTAAASSAATTKTVGPNFISWNPTASPSRYFPKISSIIANSATTGFVASSCTTCDAGMLSEALSSVARDLNFRVTVRDNAPYSATAPVKIGQTNFDDMKVTVVAGAGPFTLTSPNTAVSLLEGSNQTVTWNVAGTDTNGINEKFVDIYYSTDGGNTYPTLLASKVPNDGSETITIPVSAASGRTGSQNRIMVKANNNIFFDISNANIATTVGGTTFSVAFNGVSGNQNQGVCQGANTLTYTFDYNAMGGFSGTTNFTASGVPANTTVAFSPTSRTTDGAVTMTVTTTATTPIGLANIIVTGTSGATTKTAPFYLDISGAPALTTLSAPSDNAVAQNTTTNLTWATAANATSYDVQVATDNAFTSIISSGTVTTTTYQISGLSQATAYYWRVLAKNASCTGIFGSSFKFTTGVTSCATTAASGAQIPKNIAIPTANTVTSTITIPAASGGTIADLNITMNINHTWAGDLVGTLTSPSGTIVQLFSRPCDADATNGDIIATFDDAGSPQVCPGITGTVVPSAPLSAFNNLSSTGTWTLTIDDVSNNDGGSLNSWSLNICTIQPLSAPSFEGFADFGLFPNPNKGDFNVKFTSASTNEIKVNVHDMRGRQVYEKLFSNTGAFNQNINLNKVEAGIYLVTITDGAKKTVKRIVIE
ncbi:proprotein convertase P-domain-containing protein [Flavobacterium psychrophilum]|uniref:zinc-dependent metalloprotease n=1 Tax=Flavobacterium psychrophilum TaxID=96345 RepID=UPI000B7C0E93|nr:zinc-dependent metalloprotease family protein [Flavobacterium psychrophilum]MBF2022855.1 proprotein convertase P-domain-containing protein [Flavobacterium psychrophilum]MCB6071751.1 proprotein convertase P-domain-containing protein [Flavobacterium psychrophilum]MCB6109052.1 proprotein convertase P-domain-containing protein [Flavobacterium psychrophilum]QZK99763.1 proprotein convertase P-domain-containing protein [Flavobacterium psychrophilum]SNA65683.1 Psychrophilic metalloprotease Fpp1 [Fl